MNATYDPRHPSYTAVDHEHHVRLWAPAPGDWFRDDRAPLRPTHTATGQPERLTHLRKARTLLTLQTREVRRWSSRMLQTKSAPPDVQRNLLHLRSRMEGVLEQLDDVIRVAERLMSRPLPGPLMQDAGRERPASETVSRT
ncbi:hypothetical protein [Rhodocaloribacter sp.]